MASAQGAPQVQATLLAQPNPAPNKPFWVAVHLQIPPGWHTYYINPGDSGGPLMLTWHLPKGYKAGPIRWPVPERKTVAGIAGYVYENSAWFFAQITPPKAAAPNPKIAAHAEWLVCKDICVPQRADLTLQQDENEDIAQAFAALPQPLPAGKARAQIFGKAAHLTVAVQGANPEFFPASPDAFGADQSTFVNANGHLTIVTKLSQYAQGPPKRMQGILTLTGPNGKDAAYWIDAPLPNP